MLPLRQSPNQQEHEQLMPKMKSHKGAAKRFGKTGSGKIVRVKAWRGHHLDIKSSSRTRRYAGKAVVTRTSEEQVRRMLPYL
jgi:large subunit ribosomal protein L35